MYSLQKVKKQIIDLITKSIKERASISEADLGAPPQKEMGDFAFGCFKLQDFGKKFNKSLQEISSEITDYINKNKKGTAIKEAVSDGPYVNIFLDKKVLARMVLGEISKKKESYGNFTAGRGKKVMIEYSQPNTHKEFHIGHLRNVCLGSELVKLYKVMGYNVISANYIGDVGAHVAKCLWAYMAKGAKEPKKKNKGEYLGELYSWATQKIADNPQYKKQVEEIQQKLENGDKKLTALWKKTREWSLKEFNRIYKDLGVEFDVVYYESEVEKPGKKLVYDLLAKGIAGESQGAIIIDLIPYDLGAFLILKSDGTSLYATKDLALAVKKFKKYKLDQSIYVVDSRQELYFKQLFKALEIIGFKKPMHHLSYEAVTLPDGAMSSRKGNIVTFREFEKELFTRSQKETKKRHKDWDPKKINKVAKKIAYAAMKFDILKHDSDKVMVFDLDEALSFDGFTGPYIQYTIARINSIFAKSKTRNARINYSLFEKPEEKKLIMQLAKFPEIIKKAQENFQMSLLPRYLYDLSKAFAEFYHEVPVLKADKKTKAARLALISSVKIVLEKGLDILGIETVKEM